MAKWSIFSQGLLWEKYIKFDYKQLFHSTHQRCAVSNHIVSKKRYGPVSKKSIFEDKNDKINERESLLSMIMQGDIAFMICALAHIKANLLAMCPAL